jgi:heterodisulfide reductase subunit C
MHVIGTRTDAAEEDLTDVLNKRYLMLNNKASSCKKCRTCEKRCPFDVSVTINM